MKLNIYSYVYWLLLWNSCSCLLSNFLNQIVFFLLICTSSLYIFGYESCTNLFFHSVACFSTLLVVWSLQSNVINFHKHFKSAVKKHMHSLRNWMKLSLHRHTSSSVQLCLGRDGVSRTPEDGSSSHMHTWNHFLTHTHFPNAEVEWQVSANWQASPLQSEWAENYISEWQAVRKGQRTLEHRLDGVKPLVRVWAISVFSHAYTWPWVSVWPPLWIKDFMGRLPYAHIHHSMSTMWTVPLRVNALVQCTTWILVLGSLAFKQE